MSWGGCITAMDTALAGAVSELAIPLEVIWHNVQPEAMPTGPHLRVSVLPGQTVAPWGSGTRRRESGIYQVSVYVQAGTGPEWTVLVDALVAALDRKTLAGPVYTGIPTPTLPIQDGTWLHVPISIPFETR